MPGPTLDEIKARSSYCTWHTVHGPKDIETLLRLLDRAKKAAEGHKADAKKHHGHWEQTQAAHASVVKAKGILQAQLTKLRTQVESLNGAEEAADKLRGVLDHIREVSDYPR